MSKEAAAAGGNFESLIALIQGQAADTETLSKAVADDSSRIEAAAAEAGAGEGEGDEDGKKKPDAEGGACEAGETPMGKSFTMRDADGNETEGYDATDLLKSMLQRQETLEANSTKGLEMIMGVVKSQGELIKSLHEQVRVLGAQGRGRKAVLAVSETAGEDLSKALPGAGGAAAGAAKPGISRSEYVEHMQAAAEGNMISWHQANLAEACLNKGMEPPAEVTAAVARVKARLEANG